MKETLKLTEQEARMIIWDDDENFKIINQSIVDTTRWSIITNIIVQRQSDGKFFKSCYSKGATECQDERPYEGEDPVFEEVFPVEKTVTIYE
jgi:hypothetical protein